MAENKQPVKQKIEVSENYIDNIVWCSIDPKNGKINLYPFELSQIIETNFKDNEESVYLPEFYNSKINLKRFYQTTKNGFRSVFRYEIDNYEIIDNQDNTTVLPKTIEKTVFYCSVYNAWYLQDNKTSHIGFLADKSGSMSCTYQSFMEKAIEFYLKEQKTLDNKTLLYAGVFSNKFELLYNGTDFKNLPDKDLENTFYKIVPSGSTAYYDSITQLTSIINEQFLPGDEAIICTVTDGEDNVSQTSSRGSVFDMIKEKKSKGWMYTIIGSNLDVASNSQDYGLTRDESINVGRSKTDIENVFKCVTSSVTRARTTGTNSLSYTQDERNSSNTN